MKLLFCFLFFFLLTAFPEPASGNELQLLKRKTERQQQELDRLTALLTEKENQLRKLRIWMANVSADGRLTNVSDREQRLLHGLKILSESSGNMVLKTMELSEQLRPLLKTLPLASADRVRLVMLLEELERSAARVNAIADAAAAKEDSLLKNVRITALRHEFNMAVLSAGSLQGIFPGMTFVSSSGVRLRVIETRPMISGAVPVQGELKELIPGAAVKLEIIRRPAQEKKKE